MTGTIRKSILLAACTPVTWAPAPAAEQQSDKDTPYRIVNGKVGQSTFLGWRAYHSACHACHGADATGTTVAASLVERVKSLSARDFSIKVLTSYRIGVPAGEASGDDQTIDALGLSRCAKTAWCREPRIQERYHSNNRRRRTHSLPTARSNVSNASASSKIRVVVIAGRRDLQGHGTQNVRPGRA